MPLYFAYGSNLWRAQMRRRCPEHRLCGRGVLPDYRWLITARGYASVVEAEGEAVHGLVYDLSATDERALDGYEGVRAGHYRKAVLPVEVEGERKDCLVYIDPVREEGAPQAEYVDRINRGLADAGLPADYVARAIRPFVPAPGATVIRPYGEADWPALEAVHDAARPLELRGSCDPRAFVPLAREPEAEELRRSTKFVAELDGRVVGFVAVDGDYVGWLYVHPEHHGRGLGRRLLRRGLDAIEGRAWTIVLAGNEIARALYEGEGFVEVERFEGENAGYPCTCVRLVRGA